MKIRIVNTSSAPAALLIEAENEAEVAVLRNFANWRDFTNTQKSSTIEILNYGGNLAAGEFSMMLGYREEMP